jgi:ABC-type branched-subunit amino acid transport system substrate-binding protein
VTYHAGDADRDGVLDRVCALLPEAAFVAGYHDDVVAMLAGARDPRLAQLVLLGSDGWDGPDLPRLLPGRVREAFHVAHVALDEERPGLADFAQRFAAAAGVPPGDVAALAYDTARAVLSVYDASLDGPELCDRLLGIRVFEGLTGTVRMDAAGNPQAKSLVVLQLHDPLAPRFFERRDT